MSGLIDSGIRCCSLETGRVARTLQKKNPIQNSENCIIKFLLQSTKSRFFYVFLQHSMLKIHSNLMKALR